MGCLSEERLSQGLVFGPVHGEASGIVGHRAVRVNSKQRGALQSPHSGGTLWLVSSRSCSDLVRSPTERAESQRRSEVNTLHRP